MNTQFTRATERLQTYIQRAKLQGMRLIQTIKENIITPYRVYTPDMAFKAGVRKSDTPQYSIKVNGEVQEYDLHRHALGQMAGEVQIPLTFVNTLTKGEDWERRELSDLLQERFLKLNFKQRRWWQCALYQSCSEEPSARVCLSLLQAIPGVWPYLRVFHSGVCFSHSDAG